MFGDGKVPVVAQTKGPSSLVVSPAAPGNVGVRKSSNRAKWGKSPPCSIPHINIPKILN